jgi:hypothetical protein
MFGMKHLLAALFVVWSFPSFGAGAEKFTDKDGTDWYLQAPAAKWFSMPAPPVTVEYLSRSQTFKFCQFVVGKAGEVGCATVYPHQCSVWIAEDLPKPFRDAVERHELAHCHGWPADHPEE